MKLKMGPRKEKRVLRKRWAMIEHLWREKKYEIARGRKVQDGGGVRRRERSVY